jgi:hypothetical protein
MRGSGGRVLCGRRPRVRRAPIPDSSDDEDPEDIIVIDGDNDDDGDISDNDHYSDASPEKLKRLINKAHTVATTLKTKRRDDRSAYSVRNQKERKNRRRSYCPKNANSGDSGDGSSDINGGRIIWSRRGIRIDAVEVKDDADDVKDEKVQSKSDAEWSEANRDDSGDQNSDQAGVPSASLLSSDNSSDDGGRRGRSRQRKPVGARRGDRRSISSIPIRARRSLSPGRHKAIPGATKVLRARRALKGRNKQGMYTKKARILAKQNALTGSMVLAIAVKKIETCLPRGNEECDYKWTGDLQGMVQARMHTGTFTTQGLKANIKEQIRCLPQDANYLVINGCKACRHCYSAYHGLQVMCNVPILMICFHSIYDNDNDLVIFC